MRKRRFLMSFVLISIFLLNDLNCIQVQATSYDEGIIEQVEKYTSHFDEEEINSYLENGDYQKAKELLEEAKDGYQERWDYKGLTTNDMYIAYQFKEYMTDDFFSKGWWAKITSWFSGLFYNDELKDYITSQSPGKNKYKDMLKQLINDTKDDLVFWEYTQNINSSFQNIEGISDYILAAEDKETIDKKILELLDGNEKYSFTTDLSEAFTMFGAGIDYIDTTVSVILDIQYICANKEVLDSYVNLFDNIQNIKYGNGEYVAPKDLRDAAQELKNELEGDISKIIESAIYEYAYTSAVMGMELAELIGNGLLGLEIGSFMGNAGFDMSGLVEGVSYVQGYAYLGEIYTIVLEDDKANFLNYKSEENARKFRDDYNLLCAIRLKGEEAYLEMCDFSGTWLEIDRKLLRKWTDYCDKKDFCDSNIEMIKSFKFEEPKIDPDSEFVISKPLTAAEATWIIEPTYDYQRVIPLRGCSFSDIKGPYSDGQVELIENSDFYEMSFPGYSNLPQYYQVQLADGSWRLYFVPSHSDSGNIPVDELTFTYMGDRMRFDATGIVNLSALDGLRNNSYLYPHSPYYPFPWHLFTSDERGSGYMNIYFDMYTQQGFAIASPPDSPDSLIAPVKDIALHKPYPAGRIDTKNSGIDINQSLLADAEDQNIFLGETVNSTMQNDLKGYLNTDGQPITDFIYTASEDFSEGIAACSRDGKWGYIDENGKEITDFVYDGVWEYEGEYDAGLGEHGGFLTKYAAYPCTSDTMVVWYNGQVGVLYRDGQILVDFGEFEDMAPAYNNELWAKQNGLWGLINLADMKRKVGVPSVLTVPTKTEIPDPEYRPYVEEQYPKIMPFDYPSRESQVYEFYQNIEEFQTTISSTSMYTSPNGDCEVAVIPTGEVIDVYGINQSIPGWLCVEWRVEGTRKDYFGWVMEQNLSPLNSN